MFMDVDQPWRDNPSSRIEDFRGVRRCDVRLQGRNLSLSYCDIHDAIDFLTRIQNTPPLNDEIIFCSDWER